MNDNNRRFFSPEQKVAILREHLVEGKAAVREAPHPPDGVLSVAESIFRERNCRF